MLRFRKYIYQHEKMEFYLRMRDLIQTSTYEL